MQRQADARKQAEEARRQAEASQRAGEGRRLHADAARNASRSRAVIAGLLLMTAIVSVALGRTELAIGIGLAGVFAGYMAYQAWVQGQACCPLASPSSCVYPAS